MRFGTWIALFTFHAAIAVHGQEPPNPALSAPSSVAAGTQFDVKVENAGPGRDYLTVTAADAVDAETGTPAVHINGEFGMAKAPTGTITRSVRAPDSPGTYELRYVKFRGGREVLARIPISVTNVGAEVHAPKSVVAGGLVAIDWQGPGNKGDVISLVPRDQPDDRPLAQSWAYAKSDQKGPMVLHASAAPGAYEVRYLTGLSKQTLARAALEITKPRGDLKLPEHPMAGGLLSVTWSGPRDPNDTLVVAAASAPGKPLVEVVPPMDRPLVVDSPEAAGDHELRYISGRDGSVMAAAQFTLAPPTATTNPPAEVAAGAVFEARWSGPGHPRDYLALRRDPSAAPQSEPRSTLGTSERVQLRAPDTPGEFQLCYVAHQSRSCLASARIRVTANTPVGSIQVRPADSQPPPRKRRHVEIVLDASGTTLKSDGRERRIDAAKKALSDLGAGAISAGDAAALRVFGNGTANSCRTSLDVPFGAFDAGVWESALSKINPTSAARAPLAQALRAVASDIKEVHGARDVVLVTNGEDTCDGDPAAAAKALVGASPDTRLHIIGLAIEDYSFEASLAQWARASHGIYTASRSANDLPNRLRDTLGPQFEVIADNGSSVARGAVGGSPVEVAPGAYSLRTIGRTPSTLGRVRVTPGQVALLDIPDGAAHERADADVSEEDEE